PISEANTAAANLLGTAKGDLVTKPLSAFVVPEDRETYRRFSQSPLHMGAPRQCKLRMAKKDGVIIWAHLAATALHDADGSLVSQVLIQDVTSHKQTQEALIRSEENFRRSLEDSPLGVRIVTPKGELIYANRAILAIYGCESFDELKALPVRKLYTAESYAEHKKRRLERRRGKRGPTEYEVDIIRKNGEIRHLDVVRRPILWNGEEQFQVIYRDITDRRRMEEDLRRKEEEKGIESQQLAETNMALRALLRDRDEDRKAMEKHLIDNIHQLIIPYVNELRKLHLNPSQLSYLDIIDANLQQLANPFLQNMSSRFIAFTPREIQIANLIREGKTNKEIGDFIKTAPRSVEFHRNNIRRKAGLKGKKINLRSFLLSLSHAILT
ncbi:MAG: PAS domain S-box protein, partial [Deltaproteobacteria bacterium]|nr:PAS domain S-box protein [Deltaproteobacteria bacterium]